MMPFRVQSLAYICRKAFFKHALQDIVINLSLRHKIKQDVFTGSSDMDNDIRKACTGRVFHPQISGKVEEINKWIRQKYRETV